MANSRTINLPPQTVYANGTGARFIPGSPWMTAEKVARLRATLEVLELLGSIGITRAFQTANVPNAPDAAVAIGSAITTNNSMNFAGASVDVSANTGNKQLVRLGYNVANTTGTQLNLAVVSSVWTVQEPG